MRAADASGMQGPRDNELCVCAPHVAVLARGHVTGMLDCSVTPYSGKRQSPVGCPCSRWQLLSVLRIILPRELNVPELLFHARMPAWRWNASVWPMLKPASIRCRRWMLICSDATSVDQHHASAAVTQCLAKIWQPYTDS